MLIQKGSWYFKVRQSTDPDEVMGKEFLGWCAQTPELGDSPLEVNENVYFDFGSTREEVMTKLYREVLN